MCLTVCLGISWSEACSLHSNCFLSLLSDAPPLVPPSLGGVPGCAWLRRAGRAGPHRIQCPSRGYSCLCLFARCLLFSVAVFAIVTVDLAGAPGRKAWWESCAPGNAAAPGCQAREAGSQTVAQGLPEWMLSGTALLGVSARLQPAGLCQHALAEQACKNPGGPARCLWGWLAFLFCACLPLVPLSRNSNLCQAPEGSSGALPWSPQSGGLQTFKITHPWK